MPSRKEWTLINISLTFIALLLLLNFVGAELPSMGNVLYALDKEQPRILVEWEGKTSLCTDLDRCCRALQQVECTPAQGGGADWYCAAAYSPEYWLNNKVYAYCRQQPYWNR